MKSFKWICLLLFPTFLSAQKVSFGVSHGYAFYAGDLSAIYFTSFSGNALPAFGALVSWKSDAPYALRFQTNFTRLSANDLDTKNANRKLNFQTNLLEAYFAIDIDALAMFGLESKVWHPFFFVGFGGFYFKPEAYIADESINLRTQFNQANNLASTHLPYEPVQSMIPFGGGLKISVNKQTELMLELGVRKTFTDYIDDVSVPEINYLGQSTQQPGLTTNKADAKAFPKSGKYKDWYSLAMISIAYKPRFVKRPKRVKSKLICPKF